MKKKKISIFTAAIILFAAVLAFAQVPDAQVENSKLESIFSKKTDPFVYIVLMAQDPAITYEGGITGLQATRPKKGKKINLSKIGFLKWELIN